MKLQTHINNNVSLPWNFDYCGEEWGSVGGAGRNTPGRSATMLLMVVVRHRILFASRFITHMIVKFAKANMNEIQAEGVGWLLASFL